MKIKEFMSQPVTVVGEDATLEEIARTMLGQNIGCVPVVDARGKISGNASGAMGVAFCL
ncbi:MAG TPA: CBS domain-containing protein [Blastocatellia bacterium]|nr:CBS domain-containing protein [Blastocatellia bacterium]